MSFTSRFQVSGVKKFYGSKKKRPVSTSSNDLQPHKRTSGDVSSLPVDPRPAADRSQTAFGLAGPSSKKPDDADVTPSPSAKEEEPSQTPSAKSGAQSVSVSATAGAASSEKSGTPVDKDSAGSGSGGAEDDDGSGGGSGVVLSKSKSVTPGKDSAAGALATPTPGEQQDEPSKEPINGGTPSISANSPPQWPPMASLVKNVIELTGVSEMIAATSLFFAEPRLTVEAAVKFIQDAGGKSLKITRKNFMSNYVDGFSYNVPDYWNVPEDDDQADLLAFSIYSTTSREMSQRKESTKERLLKLFPIMFHVNSEWKKTAKSIELNIASILPAYKDASPNDKTIQAWSTNHLLTSYARFFGSTAPTPLQESVCTPETKDQEVSVKHFLPLWGGRMSRSLLRFSCFCCFCLV